jgi:hypothetical protein
MHRRHSFRAIGSAALLLAVAVSGSARAQDVLFDVPDPSPNSAALAVAGVGDWDGDGVGDFAIGAPLDDAAGTDAGVVRIYSGRNASVLATLPGATAGDQFGAVVIRIPDLDGDGKDELAVLASGAFYAGHGSVFLMKGGTGAQLLHIDCPVGEGDFGYPLGSIGDVDGDGTGDLFISFGGWHEKVSIRSGADGHEIALFTGSNELFGYSVDALDDLDGDGVRELLVGAPYHQDAQHRTIGAAYVISTATGSVLRTHLGQFDGESVGISVGTLADLDGDGVREYAVGAYPSPGSSSGKVVVHSGASGAPLATILSPGNGLLIGAQIADAGDVNGDGVGDWMTDGSWTDPKGFLHGAVFLFSGRTNVLLDHVEFDDPFAVLSPRLGDLDGDGIGDLALGSCGVSSVNSDVHVYAGDDLWLDARPTHPVAGTSLALATREGSPGALELLVLEAVDGVATFAVVSGPALFDATGGVAFTAKTPSGLAGHDFTLRAFAKDALGRTIQSAPQTVSCK